MSDKQVKRVGTRKEVMSGGALQTSGGLTRKDLTIRKGKIISVRKSRQALENNGKAQDGILRWRLASKVAIARDGGTKMRILRKADRVYTDAKTLHMDPKNSTADALRKLLREADTLGVFRSDYE